MEARKSEEETDKEISSVICKDKTTAVSLRTTRDDVDKDVGLTRKSHVSVERAELGRRKEVGLLLQHDLQHLWKHAYNPILASSRRTEKKR
jgi:hypothetical protein